MRDPYRLCGTVESKLKTLATLLTADYIPVHEAAEQLERIAADVRAIRDSIRPSLNPISEGSYND